MRRFPFYREIFSRVNIKEIKTDESSYIIDPNPHVDKWTSKLINIKYVSIGEIKGNQPRGNVLNIDW